MTSLQAPSSRVIAGREAPSALPLGELSPKVTPLVDESFDDEYEDTITIPVPLEAFGDAGLLGKDLHIQVIDGAVVITEDTDDE